MIHPFVEDGRLTHIRQGVERIARSGRSWTITGEDGQRVDADILIIATSHPSPLPPHLLGEVLAGHPRFVLIRPRRRRLWPSALMIACWWSAMA